MFIQYKKIIMAVAILCTSMAMDVGCCCSMAQGVGLGGYWELSPVYYPKTVDYFAKLKAKYPIAKEVPILILAGPMADADTIYFPMTWIEDLEKGNKFYLDATEWIFLHEMGHIFHKDILKAELSYYTMLIAFSGAAIFVCTALAGALEDCHDLKSWEKNQTLQSDLEDGVLSAFLVGVGSVVTLLYLLGTREYAADAFAMQYCDNPAAWIAAYEFLDRYAPLGFLPGIAHSFTKYRLSLIAKGFKDKFGYDLKVVPQSLKPEFV